MSAGRKYVDQNAFAALQVEDGASNQGPSSSGEGLRKRKKSKSNLKAEKPVEKQVNGHQGHQNGHAEGKAQSTPTKSTQSSPASKGTKAADATSSSPSRAKARPQSPPAKGENKDQQGKSGKPSRFEQFKGKLMNDLEDLQVRLKKEKEGDYTIIAPGTPFNEIHLSDLKFGSSDKKLKPVTPRSWKSWAFGRKFWFPAGIAIGLAFSAYQFTPLSDLPPDILEALGGPGSGASWAIPNAAKSVSDWVGGLDLKMPALDLEGWSGDWSWTDLAGNFSFLENTKKALASREFKVGEDLAKSEGLTAHHPVIMIPGIVTSGLESWSTHEDAKGWWRKRLWGTTTMVQAVLADRYRWMEALALDPETGLDPPQYKIRASQGLDAASQFIEGVYWVWLRIVQNLAAIGYDNNGMDMASYDWRLSYYNLEVRDKYFTRLKQKIESFRHMTGKKVVLVSHSMGGSVVMYFLKWVEADPALDIDGLGFGGGGGPQWVEENVESFVNIAGTLLGVSKAMTAFLSGEMKDTVEIHPAGSWVLEKFFSRKDRANLFRRWPGSASMWMKGTDRIWGNHTHAVDDPTNCTDTHGRFFSFRHTEGKDPHPSQKPDFEDLNQETVQPNMTMNEAGAYVLMHTPTTFQKMLHNNYSNGFESDVEKLQANNRDHRKWSNPLEVQLPNAPSLKVYCLYGHGKPTERSYWYMRGDYEHDGVITEGDDAMSPPEELQLAENGTVMTRRTPLDLPLSRVNFIDTEVTIEGSNPAVRRGVKFGNGDGTVPTLSLGLMCRKWNTDKRWNPAGIPVVTQEFEHNPETFDLRGGATTGDHIDVLGSTPLNEAVMRIVAGAGHRVQDSIVSDIDRYMEAIDWDT